MITVSITNEEALALHEILVKQYDLDNVRCILFNAILEQMNKVAAPQAPTFVAPYIPQADPASLNSVEQDLAWSGDRVGAIKHYRKRVIDSTLAGAKHEVDGFLVLYPTRPAAPPATSIEDMPPLNNNEKVLCHEKQPIAAIKLYRQRTGFSLKDAKDKVCEYRNKAGLSSASLLHPDFK